MKALKMSIIYRHDQYLKTTEVREMWASGGTTFDCYWKIRDSCG
jgi:hypothetical protein